MKEYDRDIHERIYQYILRVLQTLRRIPKTFENQILIAQLTRSITSMGANDQEANGTFTRADFTHCYTMVRKEGKESLFWIRLLGDLNVSAQKEIRDHLLEGDEIIRIITSIILKTRKKV